MGKTYRKDSQFRQKKRGHVFNKEKTRNQHKHKHNYNSDGWKPEGNVASLDELSIDNEKYDR